jgi:hypothetical protein
MIEMDAAQWETLKTLVYLTSFMMFLDNLYSLTYFQYTYMLELKNRFAVVGKGLPTEYRMMLRAQIKKENGSLRNFVQSAYIPWFVLCLFANMWYLPLIVTALTWITNLIYKRPYISPIMLMINLLVFNCSYLFGIVYLYQMK